MSSTSTRNACGCFASTRSLRGDAGVGATRWARRGVREGRAWFLMIVRRRALWLQFSIDYYAARREIWLITLLIDCVVFVYDAAVAESLVVEDVVAAADVASASRLSKWCANNGRSGNVWAKYASTILRDEVHGSAAVSSGLRREVTLVPSARSISARSASRGGCSCMLRAKRTKSKSLLP